MAGEDCIFCRIRDGKLTGDVVLDTEDVFVLRDIHPQAPTHLLIIPKEHVATVSDLSGDWLGLMGRLTDVANEAAKIFGVAQSGYRLVINSGPDSGNEVAHLHVHLLAGKRLGGLG